jgi:hypothetical protein
MAGKSPEALKRLRVSGETVAAQDVADFLHIPLSRVLDVAARQLHNRQSLTWAMFLPERKHAS